VVVHKARRIERATVRQVHRAVSRTHTARFARRASGRGAAVVAYAEAQLGRMYSFGGLDCSGLTKGAYARVGVSLPHKASQQDEHGSRESQSSARPGDLVFWGGDDAYHVAVYIGGGRVIHAPGRGRRVQVAKVWGSPTYVRVN
jgi:cell wall-associated NlpC family hydrolase